MLAFGSQGTAGYGTEFTSYRVEGSKAVFTRAVSTAHGEIETSYDQTSLANRIQKFENQGQASCIGANEREALAKLQALNMG